MIPGAKCYNIASNFYLLTDPETGKTQKDPFSRLVEWVSIDGTNSFSLLVCIFFLKLVKMQTTRAHISEFPSSGAQTFLPC